MSDWLLELEELEAKATPEPWEIADGHYPHMPDYEHWVDGIYSGDKDIVETDSGVYPPRWPDAKLICALRNNAKELIRAAREGAVIADQAKEIEKLRELLASVEWAGDFADDPACPICLSRRFKGHAEDCRLKEALGG